MKEFTCTIRDAEGLHARPAGALAKKAAGYQSKIMVEKAGKAVDCRRMMAVMSLCIKQGEEIRVTITGQDEDAAADGMRSFFCV